MHSPADRQLLMPAGKPVQQGIWYFWYTSYACSTSCKPLLAQMMLGRGTTTRSPIADCHMHVHPTRITRHRSTAQQGNYILQHYPVTSTHCQDQNTTEVNIASAKSIVSSGYKNTLGVCVSHGHPFAEQSCDHWQKADTRTETPPGARAFIKQSPLS